MSDEMDAMMADGLLHTVRECARRLYGENQIHPCDDIKRMASEIDLLRAPEKDLGPMKALVASNLEKRLRTEAGDLQIWCDCLAIENNRLRASLRNMEQHMEENITLTEALRQEQEWVIRLSKALRGVIRAADRNTAEFNEARAALGGKDE